MINSVRITTQCTDIIQRRYPCTGCVWNDAEDLCCLGADTCTVLLLLAPTVKPMPLNKMQHTQGVTPGTCIYTVSQKASPTFSTVT